MEKDNTSEHDLSNLNTSAAESEPDTANTFHAPTSGIYNDRPRGSSKLMMLILAVIVLVVIGASAYFLRGKFSGRFSEPSPSPLEEIPVSASTPFPTPSHLERSKYTIRVLNGTSKSGLAASVSAKLKGLGYKIEKTGNASDSATPRTLVRVKESATGLLDVLIKDLSPDYDASDSGKLKTSDDVDGEVVLGAK